jgi:hypothetical protein
MHELNLATISLAFSHKNHRELCCQQTSECKRNLPCLFAEGTQSYEGLCCAQHPGIGHVMMEALLVLLARKLEGQPHTYLCTESPLGPHFSWTIPAETYEPANRNRNSAYSQQIDLPLSGPDKMTLDDYLPRHTSTSSSTSRVTSKISWPIYVFHSVVHCP